MGVRASLIYLMNAQLIYIKVNILAVNEHTDFLPLSLFIRTAKVIYKKISSSSTFSDVSRFKLNLISPINLPDQTLLLVSKSIKFYMLF